MQNMSRLATLALRSLRSHQTIQNQQQQLSIFCALTQLQPQSTWLQSKTIHGSAPAFDSKELINILQQEAQHEKDNYVSPEEVKKGPPSPFKLISEPGNTLMKLQAQHNKELVSVEFAVNDQPDPEYYGEGEDEQEENILIRKMYNVYVIKGDVQLVFEMLYNGEEQQIMHVSYTKVDDPLNSSEHYSPYTGPVFEELDSELQAHLHQYVEERGITAELAAYVSQLVEDKEQTEYVGWLDNVKQFVSK